MRFSEIIGQQNIKNQLILSVKENRVSHAQLFNGPEGAGALPLALAYAQYIGCENKNENDSCGICKPCQKYSKLIHPDLHFVFPVVNTVSSHKVVSDDFLNEWRKELLENPYMNLNHWTEAIAQDNKQVGIFEKESGEIIRKLNLKTYEAEYKVMIIWMPEKMHIVAANKLLKMIEEPPAKTLFILVSENSGQILTTILSRTQFVKIPPIGQPDMQTALSKLISDKGQINDITRIAGGNYFKALELIHSQDDENENFNLFVNLMRLCYKSDVTELIKWSENAAALGREKQKTFLKTCLRLIRENFVMNTAHKSIAYLTGQEAEFSEKFHHFINNNNVYKINDELNKALYHIESNGNSKIILLDLALKMAKLIIN